MLFKIPDRLLYFEYFSQFWTPRRRWRSAVSRTMVRLSGDVIPPPVLQLVTQLRSGTDADKNMASAKIGRLLTTGKRAARDFLKAGVVPVLVTLARNGSGLQKQNAAGALALLSRYEETRDAIVAAGGVNPIVALLRSSPRLQIFTLNLGQKDRTAPRFAHSRVRECGTRRPGLA